MINSIGAVSNEVSYAVRRAYDPNNPGYAVVPVAVQPKKIEEGRKGVSPLPLDVLLSSLFDVRVWKLPN